MKRLSREAAERALQERKGPDFIAALRAVPDGVSPPVVAEAAAQLLAQVGNGPWFFARNCQGLPAPVIEALLVRLEQEPGGLPIFLREAMRLRGSLSVSEAWRTALLAVLDLTSSYAWGSKQLKAKFRALAGDPRMLASIQAAVVGARMVPLSLLAVLATHGGEEAADALLTVFEKGRHGAIEQLATHAAKTPAMQALLASSTQAAEAAEKSGPFSQFALAAWGFEVPRGRVSISFGSEERGTIPGQQELSRYQGGVHFSTSGGAWWTVSLTDITESNPREASIGFSPTFNRTAMGLEACAVEEIPEWIANAGRVLKTRWRPPTVWGSVRGKKRDVIAAWLLP